MTRISSRKYVDGARGQPCTFRIPGDCDGGGETTVFCHIRDRHTGKSIKASDTSGGDGCARCHARFDGRAGFLLTQAEWHFYALRAMQETLENRINRGIVIVPLDAHAPHSERPAKQRKPRAQRKAVPNNPERKIPSRKFQKAPA